jgi:hypothetical protein
VVFVTPASSIAQRQGVLEVPFGRVAEVPLRGTRYFVA